MPELYREMVRTAAIEAGGADIGRFLGKKPRAPGQAETGSRRQTLVQGTRLKHTLGATSLEMYDKDGSVLRMECTTSDVTTFQHRRGRIKHFAPRTRIGSGRSTQRSHRRREIGGGGRGRFGARGTGSRRGLRSTWRYH